MFSGFTANTPEVPSIAEVVLPIKALLNAAPTTFGSAPTPGTNGEAKLKLSTRCAGKPELFTKSSKEVPLNFDAIILLLIHFLQDLQQVALLQSHPWFLFLQLK